MSESYDTQCGVGARQIVAPIGAGEARIPALVRLHDERLILFFDERPAPASGTGADFNGLTMASDLPNPNRIRWMERDGRGGWSDPCDLPAGAPPVSSDACVGVDGGGLMHLAFASSEGAVGYMDSRAGGERLRAWWAWGSGPAELTYADMTDALYEVTGASSRPREPRPPLMVRLLCPTSCAWGSEPTCRWLTHEPRLLVSGLR